MVNHVNCSCSNRSNDSAVDLSQGFRPVTLGPTSYGDIDESYNYEAADARSVYRASKTIADKRIWQLKKGNPDVDITVREYLVL